MIVSNVYQNRQQVIKHLEELDQNDLVIVGIYGEEIFANALVSNVLRYFRTHIEGPITLTFN